MSLLDAALAGNERTEKKCPSPKMGVTRANSAVLVFLKAFFPLSAPTPSMRKLDAAAAKDEA